MSLEDKASIVLPKGFAGKAGTLECWNPNTDTLVGLSVVRATTATRVNESGLIESVAANVPRRDFTNGGCGDLLVEPQRTNLVRQSENIATSPWSVVGVGTASAPVVTANAAVAPDGNTTADRVVFNLNGGTTSGDISQLDSGIITISTATAYSGSIYLKSFDGSSYDVAIDVDSGPAPDLLATVTSEWQRFELPNKISISVNGFFRIRLRGSEATSDTADILVWGVQLEQGSYVTSYIPTTTAAVTRNADVISGTSLAALLGDSAGGIYVRGRVFDASTSNVIEISNSSDAANERVQIDINSTNITGKTTDGGVEQATLNAAGATNNTEFAACYNYALNSFSIQKDGTTAATDSAGTTPSGLDQIRLTDGSTPFYGRISELVIFNQRPDNTQGEAVTA